MQRTVILTKDGSHTIAIQQMNVTYHSIHGAIQESKHVFINAGLIHLANQLTTKPTKILEVGFGSGLNALLTYTEAERTNDEIHYTAIEPFPIEDREIRELNYCEQLQREELQTVFEKLHNWEASPKISDVFYLYKLKQTLQDHKPTQKYHLIYFDAFAPKDQPELWTREIFEKIFSMTNPGGILVTYCSKGDVRRNLQSAGFDVEKIAGPPGKREMIRSVRPA